MSSHDNQIQIFFKTVYFLESKEKQQNGFI